MIVGAQLDAVAAVASHSLPFYISIPSSSEEAYVELRGASHFVASTGDTWRARSMIVWLERYVDDDTRYERLMWPNPSSLSLSDCRGTCPG